MRESTRLKPVTAVVAWAYPGQLKSILWAYRAICETIDPYRSIRLCLFSRIRSECPYNALSSFCERSLHPSPHPFAHRCH